MTRTNESPLSGQIASDESFFGARRVKGKRGRGAYAKTIVFGLIKRQAKCIHKSFQIAPNLRCQRSFEAK